MHYIRKQLSLFLTDLTCHWLRVYLAHVDPRVISLYTVEPQSPTVVPVVFYAHSRVVRDHMRVDGQNCLRV